MTRIPLAEQAAELWRIYQRRDEAMLRGAIPPHQRATAREQQRRQERLLAAFRSLAWLSRHPAVLRGYLAFCDPLTRESPDWPEPPPDLAHAREDAPHDLHRRSAAIGCVNEPSLR